jgi:hypothetical protein
LYGVGFVFVGFADELLEQGGDEVTACAIVGLARVGVHVEVLYSDSQIWWDPDFPSD